MALIFDLRLKLLAVNLPHLCVESLNWADGHIDHFGCLHLKATGFTFSQSLRGSVETAWCEILLKEGGALEHAC
jgi:hypothetical protein